jgi:SRSO17 transposase
LQRLLGRATCDADAVRDEVTRYAAAHVLGEGEAGVLIMDETGFLKKGVKSVGVQRQYSGTAGRIENGQVGVFLAWCGSRGRALIDRALYLPKVWCEDAPRRREAGVPTSVNFATKPQLALEMIGRALDAGLRPRWVLGDEVYGSDGKTSRFLESRDQPYVLAVSGQQRLWVDLQPPRVDRIAEQLPEDHWFRLSIAESAKGPRVYDGAAGQFGVPTEKGLRRWVLIRRRVDDPSDRAYYLCAAPPHAAAQDLAIAAGQRWSIETCFETAKQEVGLDDYEVRSWTGWHRHATLSMLALAFLAAVRARADAPTQKGALNWCR